MQFCLVVSIQQQAQEACLLEGESGLAQTCHTHRRVQQRAHGTMPGVFFQPVRVEMQRLRRR
jgi:hypothetical protein